LIMSHRATTNRAGRPGWKDRARVYDDAAPTRASKANRYFSPLHRIDR
jgi:hypothetical protein